MVHIRGHSHRGQNTSWKQTRKSAIHNISEHLGLHSNEPASGPITVSTTPGQETQSVNYVRRLLV